jgi:epidermal growth factor receptor
MSVPSNRDHHYRNLKDRYTNCTYVDGNLELTWLQDENLDLSFLKYIREVTGYVLISHVDIKRIVLPRLQIIRGRTLFKMNVREEEFSLLVTLSKMFTLELPSLRDVLKGSIGLFNNYNLCHVKTINWKEIITDPVGRYVFVYNFTSPERDCPSCHKNCEKGCWGEGEENCQKFSKENCSPQCYQGRCFGPNPRECCHLFCAGGCTGPKQSDCIACRNFYDSGVCTQECPPMQIYNPTTYSWEDNPKGKYAYGATCVKNCPEHLLKDNGACVRTCPPHKKAKDGACVPCEGPCPKTCPVDSYIHSGNIDSFKGCTVIEGNVIILQNTFEGLPAHLPELHVRREVRRHAPRPTGSLQHLERDHRISQHPSLPQRLHQSVLLQELGSRRREDALRLLHLVVHSEDESQVARVAISQEAERRNGRHLGEQTSLLRRRHQVGKNQEKSRQRAHVVQQQ